ncbi:MAG: HK97 gp10 family phage protein [Gammaproteobacteria bacterium]|nr:HK97 gp10 family phage protein [Gammaproteobacteria bacterium]
MTDGLDFNIQGLDAAVRGMKSFSPKLQKRGLAAAARKGANVIRDAARANARAIDDPQTAELIAKNISTQGSRRLSRKISGAAIRVGVMGGADIRKRDEKSGLPGGATQHWRLVEFGTEDTPAQPFLRPAGETNHQNVLEAVATELEKQVTKLELL